MKNIGFLAVKQLYPHTYKDISLIFNDVDIMPFKEGVFYADTMPGIVRHNYGYTTCLSASFVIQAGDFERTGGFPNLWTWGLEDFLLQERVFAVSDHGDLSFEDWLAVQVDAGTLTAVEVLQFIGYENEDANEETVITERLMID